jgi:hypothetical protein
MQTYFVIHKLSTHWQHTVTTVKAGRCDVGSPEIKQQFTLPIFLFVLTTMTDGRRLRKEYIYTIFCFDLGDKGLAGC